MLTVENLNKCYQQRDVIKDISFSIQAGEAVGLLGANGAGKSTLIKSLVGLVKPDSGHVDFSHHSFAYLSEQPQLPLSLSASALMAYKCKAKDLQAEQVAKSLEETGLSREAWKRPLKQYSKGMRQRVSLALALCSNPDIILLDEPMSGLDALGRAEILRVFEKRKLDATAFLMSSHIVPDMVRLCDRVLIMAHGKICEQLTLKEHSLHEVKQLELRLAHWTKLQS